MRKKRVQFTIAAALIIGTISIGGCGSPDVSQVNAETAVIETKSIETVKGTEPTTEPITEPETAGQTTEPETSTETEPETITDNLEKLDKVMYATADLNVRDKSNTDGNKIGSLGYAKEVKVVARDKNTGWYQISYGDGVGFVSGKYLSDTKPAPKPVSKPSGGGSSKASGGTQSKPSSGSSQQSGSGSQQSSEGSQLSGNVPAIDRSTYNQLKGGAPPL